MDHAPDDRRKALDDGRVVAEPVQRRRPSSFDWLLAGLGAVTLAGSVCPREDVSGDEEATLACHSRCQATPPGRGDEVVTIELLDQTRDRLEELISWYDGSAKRKQFLYKGLKVASIVAAGSIPVITAASVATIVAAVLGATVVAIEGIQQLYQFHDQWLAHRYTCEALKREKFLFAAGAGPFADQQNPARLLAERIEALVAHETSTWRDLEAARTASAGSGGP